MKRAVVMIILVFYLAGCANTTYITYDDVNGVNNSTAERTGSHWIEMHLQDGIMSKTYRIAAEDGKVCWMDEDRNEITKAPEEIDVIKIFYPEERFLTGMVGAAAGALLAGTVVSIDMEEKPLIDRSPVGAVAIGAVGMFAGFLVGNIFAGLSGQEKYVFEDIKTELIEVKEGE